MKVYIHPIAPTLMRVNIKKLGVKTEFITLCEATQEDVLALVKKVAESQKISPFVKGNVTNVEVRECIDSKNGKAKSISFRGIEPEDFKKLLLKNIDELNSLNK